MSNLYLLHYILLIALGLVGVLTWANRRRW
jgi:hypothetical protein